MKDIKLIRSLLIGALILVVIQGLATAYLLIAFNKSAADLIRLAQNGPLTVQAVIAAIDASSTITAFGFALLAWCFVFGVVGSAASWAVKMAKSPPQQPASK